MLVNRVSNNFIFQQYKNKQFELSGKRAIDINLAPFSRSKKTELSIAKPAKCEMPMSNVDIGSPIGRGIYGQDCYPVNSKTTPELEQWRSLISEKSKEMGLDPFEVSFWVMARDTLLQTTARSGFPVRYKHWSFGQAYQELLLPQKHGLSRLYELVINNDPCYAYLLEENPLYAQKVVMAHVMGHSDFFKNNIMFQGTYRKMLNRLGDHAAAIERILNKENVSFEEMEKFIDKVHSIQWLIDLSNTTPRELDFSDPRNKEVEKIPEDWGEVDTSGLPSHLEKRFNDHERLTKEREIEKKRREEQLFKIPPEPERDVLAFLIERSQTLKSWQRQVLAILRNESYYFAPQLQTKIMNEGWATYWHTKITHDTDLLDLEHATNIEKMKSNVVAIQKFRINPYALGFEIFKDIEDQYNKGHYGPKWDSIVDMEERENYDTKEMKGKEKIFEVRRYYSDIEFLRTFFTPEIAKKLQLYNWDPLSRDADDSKEENPIIISSRQFNEIKTRLLEMLENGGQPIIQVTNGNFANRGELHLEHIHSYDLKQDWAEMTLENIKGLWGRPVHLDTYKTFTDGSKKQMRVSVLDNESNKDSTGKLKTIIKRFILKPNGETDYACDVNGKSLEEKEKKYFWGMGYVG